MIIKPYSLEKLSQAMHHGDACLIYSNDEKKRNHDVCYPFRPSSHFQYLSTLSETCCAIVLQKNLNDIKVSVFKRPFSAKEALWTSPRMEISNILNDPLVSDAYDISTLSSFLQTMIRTCDRLYIDKNDAFSLSATSGFTDEHIADLNPLIGQCRLYKTDEEISLISKAIHLSHLGHVNAMEIAKPGVNEAQLMHAFFEPASHQGISSWAYPPIVAGGTNACVLHYIDNNQTVHDNELVLIDAGIEFKGYASDITRTFPVNGTFTEPQRLLYETVLTVQIEAIKQIHGGVSFQEIGEIAKETMLQQLIDIKFFTGSIDEHRDKQSLSKYFYHGLGHWLGLDVHDPCPYKSNQSPLLFSEGMVFTIEPGIYVKPNSDVDKKWHGIGIRIEDNILMGEKSPTVLSNMIPKEAKTIEEICQR